MIPVENKTAIKINIGNIMMQSMAHGCIQSLAQMRQVIRNSFDVHVYEPEQTKEWEEAYENFQKVIFDGVER